MPQGTVSHVQDIVTSDCIEVSYTLKIVWRDTIKSVIHEIGVVSSIFCDAESLQNVQLW